MRLLRLMVVLLIVLGAGVAAVRANAQAARPLPGCVRLWHQSLRNHWDTDVGLIDTHAGSFEPTTLFPVRLVALALELTKLGCASQVDRADRRELSYFRRSFDFLKRCLRLNLPILPGFFPDFSLLSGG